MKNLLFTLLLSVILFSCSSDNTDQDTNVELTGTWLLTEINNDPGDGSGTFSKVKSDKILVFGENNIITSNGSLCDNSTNSDSPNSGTYTIGLECESGGLITSCSNISNLNIAFVLKGSVMYIYYPCIEGCAAKYVKK